MSGLRVSREARDEAVSIAARAYRVSPAHVLSDTRMHSASHARQLAMWMLRQKWGSNRRPRHSFPAIGRAFGFDHTTVIHSVRQVEKRLAEGSLAFFSTSLQELGENAKEPIVNSANGHMVNA